MGCKILHLLILAFAVVFVQAKSAASLSSIDSTVDVEGNLDQIVDEFIKKVFDCLLNTDFVQGILSPITSLFNIINQLASPETVSAFINSIKGFVENDINLMKCFLKMMITGISLMSSALAPNLNPSMLGGGLSGFNTFNGLGSGGGFGIVPAIGFH